MFNNFSVEVINLFKNMELERSKLHHPFVGSEHLLLALLNSNKKILSSFKKFNIDYELFKNELVRIVGIPKKNVDFNLYTPLLKRIINTSIEDAKENNKGIVTPNHLLLSLLDEGEGVAIRILITLDVDIDMLYESLINKKENKVTKNEIFGKTLNDIVDMNECAIGRDKEIKLIIETLLRKKKNNPLLIGDAGVGKTAIVEEFVRLINNNNVPKKLLNSQIVSIEMGSLISGTKYRGEFEEKLTKIIENIEKNPNIILFIDEIHTMVGAGGAEGAISAGDILKPYLARDNIKCIGATTRLEYDKTIAKDKALARRFETISIKEPNKQETLQMLLKIKGEYEKHHNVKISKNNIEEIINLSSEYINNKKNPDKSIDFLDSICSYVQIKNDKTKIVSRLFDKLKNIKLAKEEEVKNNNFDKALLLHDKEISLETKIKNLDTKTITKITKHDILKVFNKKNNIPDNNEKELILKNIAVNLNDILINDKINIIYNNLKEKFYNMNSQSSILLTSKCKDKMSSCITKLQNSFLEKINIIKLNGNDYNCESSLSKLIGTSAGYVGYNDDYIFNNIKYNPFSIIIIENFDLISSKIKKLMDQIISDGEIIDAKGEAISFKQCIIIGTIINKETKKVGFSNEYNNLKLDNNAFKVTADILAN